MGWLNIFNIVLFTISGVLIIASVVCLFEMIFFQSRDKKRQKIQQKKQLLIEKEKELDRQEAQEKYFEIEDSQELKELKQKISLEIQEISNRHEKRIEDNYQKNLEYANFCNFLKQNFQAKEFIFDTLTQTTYFKRYDNTVFSFKKDNFFTKYDDIKEYIEYAQDLEDFMFIDYPIGSLQIRLQQEYNLIKNFYQNQNKIEN